MPVYLVARAGGSVDSEMAVDRQIVGNYDVVVLEPGQAGDLARWLEDNGFASLPASAMPAVESYIEEKWCFVAARLNVDGAGSVAPHPLAVTFPTAVPLYPMRLTAAAGSDTQVDLFVIAATAWGHPACQTWLRHPFRKYDSRNETVVIPGEPFPGRSPRVSYPELLEILPDSFWMSRLHGRLTPDQMRRGDLVLKPMPSTPSRFALHTRDAIRLRATGAVILVMAFAVPLIAIFGRWPGDRYSGRRLGIGVMVTVLVGGVMAVKVARSMPAAEGFEMKRVRKSAEPAFLIRDTIQRAIKDFDPTLFEDPERLRVWMPKMGYVSPSKWPARESASPGNFMILQQPDGTWHLRVHGLGGDHADLALPPEPAASPGALRLPSGS